MTKHIRYTTLRGTAVAAALAAAMSVGLFQTQQATAAPFTTIEGITFDLGQFTGAAVTTDVPASDLHGSTFDNPNGIDGVTLGELATAHFGADEGDRISLGEVDGAQNMILLTYGFGVLIGSGDSAKFVVYEQSGRAFLDPEGISFEISINGGTFVNAGTSAAATGTGGVTGAGGTEQNQIVFDLLHPDFGFTVGDVINTVKIQNLGISGVTTDDPDFLFAGRAGRAPLTVSAPGVLALFGLGVIGLGALRRRD